MYFGLGGWGYPYGYAYGYPYYGGYPYYPYAYSPYSYSYDPYAYGGSYSGSYPPPQNYAYPDPPPQQQSRTQAPPPSGNNTSNNTGNNNGYYLIAFKDHTIQAATAYKVDGDQFHWITREGQELQVPLSNVDIPFSQQINRDRNVALPIP